MNGEQKPTIVPRGREHPHLRALDALTCNYPGWNDDKAAAEQSFFRAEGIERKIELMKRKQRVHDGDRSHPELVQLDALRCNYPGWNVDKATGEKHHFECPILVPSLVKTMRRKQKLHQGNRSHPDLVKLDQLKCTYPDWQKDKAAVERAYTDYPILLSQSVEKLIKKQKLHEGNTSHPDLVKLNRIKCTYPGWQKDKTEAEVFFTDNPSAFPQSMEKMRKKQRVHEGHRSHPDLVKLDSLKCNFPGWLQDKARGEKHHYECPILLPSLMETMRRKQRLQEGNRSDSELKQLDAITCTYPEWQNDKAEAERTYCDHPILFPQKMDMMRRKQTAHEGSAACPIAISGGCCCSSSSAVTARRPAKKRRPNVESRMPREDTSSKCVVCLTSEKTHVVQPCGHHCVCAPCSAWALDQQKCPVCRHTITSSTPATAANQKARDAMVDLTK